jgi:multicomponent Na+:H+ antiporter subunit C
MTTHTQPLRIILSLNGLGSELFVLFGANTRRRAAAGMGGDPIPQALVITGLVVAFAATALAVVLLLRLAQDSAATLRDDPPDDTGGGTTVSAVSRRPRAPRQLHPYPRGR